MRPFLFPLAFTAWSLVHGIAKLAGFRPLYTTLAPEDASIVIQKLKEGSTEYRLSNNGTTVSVPADKVAELRLELAAAGVPKSGRIGFEIFDKTNFGMTDFAEHINYRRAVEGELERSVMAIAEVEQARVHITFPKESVFSEAQQRFPCGILPFCRRAGAAGRLCTISCQPCTIAVPMQRDCTNIFPRHTRDHASDLQRRRGARPGSRLRARHAGQSAESCEARQ